MDKWEATGRQLLAVRLRESQHLRRAVDALYAGAGGFFTILVLAELSTYSGRILLIAPFGASCVLVFALPQSPLAHPRNVIGGHLVSTMVGLSVLTLLGPTLIAYALGVGLAIALMSLTRTLHPPAGADPIVVILAGASWPFLFVPVLAGAIVIVVLSTAFHRWSMRLPW